MAPNTTRFVKVLTEINKHTELTHAEANAEILKMYTRREISGLTRGTSVLIRGLVSQELTVLAKHDKTQLETAFILINQIYPKLYSNMQTLDNMFSSDVRRPMIDATGRFSAEHTMAKKLVKIPWEEKGKLIKQAKKTLFEKHGNVIFVSLGDTLKVIRECIDSKNPNRRMIALLIACGCRPNELFLSEFSKFTPASKEDAGTAPEWIKLDGLAKKRGQDVSNVRPLVYISTETFMDSLNFVRESALADFNGKITDRRDQLKPALTSAANVIIRDLYNQNPGITLYSARAIYAHVSYKLYGQFGTMHGPPGLTKPRWISQVLGHGEDNLDTANNYNRYGLTEDREEAEGLKEKVTLLENRIEDIEERSCCEPESNAQSKPKSDKDLIRDVRFEKLGQIFKKNPGIKAYQLEELAQKASPKIPRSYVRAFYTQLKIKGLV